MIYIGTAGYSYGDWKGPFYPVRMSEKDMLSFYASEFSFTEVNSTYYRLPNKYMIYNMQAKTPPGFRFSVKCYQSLTHQREDVGQDVRDFVQALAPLADSGKLACVLAQFPQSFHLNSRNTAYLLDLASRMEGLPLVVEFRQVEWLRNDIFAMLEANGLGFACVDEPQLKGLMPPVARATGPVGYVRFHGRNSEKWWRHKESYERYDYLYSKAELAEWVPKIKGITEKSKTVCVSMNNHYRGQAVINSRMLRELLKAGGAEVN